MKSIVYAAVVCFLFFTSCKKELYSTSVTTIPGTITVNPNHPMKDSLTAIVQKHLGKGVPGVQVMVKNANGLFIVNGGYSKIETKQLITDNMATWIYSISKTYMATVILKLAERGLIKLDTPAAAYLSAHVLDPLANGNKFTVRQLLNHTSGLRNHTTEPAYQLAQLNSPLDQPNLKEKIKYLHDKPALFEPGTDFAYSNSGYTLLQWIAEKVAGKSYQEILEDEIIKPLNLTKTYYGVSEARLLSLGAPNYYFERHNNAVLENVTKWHNGIAFGLEGYGGIVANGTDVIKFYEALMNGTIISNASLTQMRTWITGKRSDEPDYGLGLEYYGKYNKTTPTVTYGHEGDGLGGTTQILYVPVNNTYLFITINAGRQIAGQYVRKVADCKIDLCRYVATYR
ncbi:MAG: beta-lactamase family protein [Lacibacter sp.]|jgi:D-alanyl-D-alanine carboxypeptidase